MNTTLSTLFLVAGSTGAAMLKGLFVCDFSLSQKRQQGQQQQQPGKQSCELRVARNGSQWVKSSNLDDRHEGAKRLLWR